MEGQITHLAIFVETLATRQWHQLERLVKAAYAAGASREDLFSAIELCRQQAHVPGPVVARAYEMIHAWHWMVARRNDHLWDIAAQPLESASR
jgi:alkylhydroperoxidase/carboxymuconolactone decarboxylase family protein YurZ